jgi:hypothetical protein
MLPAFVINGLVGAEAMENPDIECMTLGNMRASGVRSLLVTCLQCHYAMVVDADHWLDRVPLSSFGPKMACAKCRAVGADVRPNWPEPG